jgi:hypothetical protein
VLQKNNSSTSISPFEYYEFYFFDDRNFPDYALGNIMDLDGDVAGVCAHLKSVFLTMDLDFEMEYINS